MVPLDGEEINSGSAEESSDSNGLNISTDLPVGPEDNEIKIHRTFSENGFTNSPGKNQRQSSDPVVSKCKTCGVFLMYLVSFNSGPIIVR